MMRENSWGQTDPNGRSASDWLFESILDFDTQLTRNGIAKGMRLFRFQSDRQSVAALVMFIGSGHGAGMRFSLKSETLEFAFEAFDLAAKPGIKSNGFGLHFPRTRVPAASLDKLTIRQSFSLSELHGSSGSVSAAGVGLGVGVGGFVASAQRRGQTLFNCQKLGMDFGRVGASITNLRMGAWSVLRAWDTSDSEIV